MTELTAVGAIAPAPPRRRRRFPRLGLLWFAVPALVPYLAIVIWPSMQGAVVALTDWNGMSLTSSFVGFDNFIAITRDPEALTAIRNTIVVAVVTTIAENVIGLALALGIHSKLKSRAVLRVIFFLPVVIITLVVAFLWLFLLNPNGPVNEALGVLGLGSLAQNWFGDPAWALVSIMVIVVWQFAGYSMVIFLAGLQDVPEEQIEAAALDGAGPVRRFWYIVRPLLAPAITVNVTLSLIRGLMIFDAIWATTKGGPASSTNSLSTLVYQNAFTFGQLGYSVAIALVLTALVAILAILQYRLVNRANQ